MDNMQILEALETLAAALPWDRVQLEVTREPEGEMCYAAWVFENNKYGFDGYACGTGKTPIDAVTALLGRPEAKDRDAAKSRDKKIAELKSQIEKLQQVVIGLPPYIPNRELAATNIPQPKPTIEV